MKDQSIAVLFQHVHQRIVARDVLAMLKFDRLVDLVRNVP